jgi:hypothetical protein
LMRETWLQANRRAILFGCVPPLIVAAVGAWLVLRTIDPTDPFWRWIGVAALVVGCGIVGLLLVQLRRPRIAFESGQVLFYLRSGPPIAVPVEIVEAFFAGQGPAHLPGVSQQPQTVNLVARLSQRHTEWAQQTVKPALGNWAEGYVTIRGSWCEPLNGEIIRTLNRRLKEVKENA